MGGCLVLHKATQLQLCLQSCTKKHTLLNRSVSPTCLEGNNNKVDSNSVTPGRGSVMTSQRDNFCLFLLWTHVAVTFSTDASQSVPAMNEWEEQSLRCSLTAPLHSLYLCGKLNLFSHFRRQHDFRLISSPFGDLFYP